MESQLDEGRSEGGREERGQEGRVTRGRRGGRDVRVIDCDERV